jgi:hypothetical protein
MGFDTSFHPVDVGLVQTRLLPFIAGEGSEHDLDDVLARAVSLYKVRIWAERWAWAAHQAAKSASSEWFKPNGGPRAQVWERPFFIVADSPDEVVEAVLRWLATPPAEVAGLAREMADRITPGMGDALHLTEDDRLPGDEELRARIARPLLLLRVAMAAALAGRQIIVGAIGEHDPLALLGRGEHDPLALLGREVSFSVLRLLSWLTPGWASRGWWPTLLYADAGLAPVGFGASEPLYGLLRDRLPQVDWFDPPTIVENWTVGGFVQPKQIVAARANLAAHRKDLLEPQPTRHWADITKNLRQVDEAMALAARLGFGFCEATEVYGSLWGTDLVVT